MPATCPFCQTRVQTSRPQPGRFRVRCPGCSRSFALIIPVQPEASWVAKPLSGEIPTPNTKTSPVAIKAIKSGSAVLDHPPKRTRPTSIGDTPLPRKKPNAAELSSKRSPASSIPDDGVVSSPALPPSDIPGYRVEKILGHGGMGTVYLARQLSLDRPVALKVMSKRWVHDPVFVARFTREAFAAALLNHPNVVQIYDIGEAEGARFFSMEYVPGRTLVDLVKAEGKLDPETAVGFLLQAARGLKHAHDRGMIHRDVKPDNLLLDEQGMVKVADLGLVKTQDLSRDDDRLSTSHEGSSSTGLLSLPANMTGTRMALGTPAYMAPEQCRDAATVDHRADIYSLGCTLYVLVTGKQPFDGHSAIEVMTKHVYEPIVPPDVIASRVPKELSAVIQKMMAKDPDDRFPNMGEVVRTLEQWLGVHHTGTFNPHDDQIETLEKHVRAFNESPAVVLRSRVVSGAISAVLLLAVLLTFFGKLGWAFGLAGMVLQTALAYFVINGVARKTYFFRRVRQFAVSLAPGDYAVLLASLGLFAVLLWMFNLFWMWLGFGCIGIGVAIGLRIWLDRAADAERQKPLETCERQLRRMRLHGVDEEEIRQFVAKFAGRNWEEFFEALFGFEAKLTTRGVLLRGGYAGVRDKFAPWREPILHLMEKTTKARKEARERKLLAQVEQARLLAAGVTGDVARDRADQAADALVKQANAYRHADARRRTVVSGHAQPTNPGVPNLGQMLQQASQENPFDFGEDERPKHDTLRFLGAIVLGPHVRAVAAALLLAASVLWVYQNRLFFDTDFSAEAAKATEAQKLDDIETQAATLERSTQPLAFDGVPAEWTSWCDSANVAWAGMLVLTSLFYRGNRMSAFVVLGAAVCVFGHRFGIRTVEPIRDFHVALMLGTVLSLVGYRFGRR